MFSVMPIAFDKTTSPSCRLGHAPIFCMDVVAFGVYLGSAQSIRDLAPLTAATTCQPVMTSQNTHIECAQLTGETHLGHARLLHDSAPVQVPAPCYEMLRIRDAHTGCAESTGVEHTTYARMIRDSESLSATTKYPRSIRHEKTR